MLGKHGFTALGMFEDSQHGVKNPAPVVPFALFLQVTTQPMDKNSQFFSFRNVGGAGECMEKLKVVLGDLLSILCNSATKSRAVSRAVSGPSRAVSGAGPGRIRGGPWPYQGGGPGPYWGRIVAGPYRGRIGAGPGHIGAGPYWGRAIFIHSFITSFINSRRSGAGTCHTQTQGAAGT